MKGHVLVGALSLFCAKLIASLCPAGSVEGLSPDQCYVFAANSLNWYDAAVECNKRGGYLASIPNAFHEMYLSNASQHKTYWTGGQMIGDFPESDWRWSDASTWAYTSWANGQPSHESYQCLLLVAKASLTRNWFSESCINPHPYVCKVPSVERS